MNINWTHATAVPLQRPKGASKNRSADFSIFCSNLFIVIDPDKYLLILLEIFNDIDSKKSHTRYYLFFRHSLKDFDLIFFGVERLLRTQSHMYTQKGILKVLRTGEDRK